MRYVTLLSVLALMFCAALLLGLNACSGGSTSTVTPVTPPTASFKDPAHRRYLSGESDPQQPFQDPVLISRGADIVDGGRKLSRTDDRYSRHSILGTPGVLLDNYDPGTCTPVS